MNKKKIIQIMVVTILLSGGAIFVWLINQDTTTDCFPNEGEYRIHSDLMQVTARIREKKDDRMYEIIKQFAEKYSQSNK